MTTQEIIDNISALVDCERLSPGEAFDKLLDLRREKVTIEQIATAFGGKVEISHARPSAPGSFVEPPTGLVTDDTVCWFGKFKGKKMKDIDNGYFEWLWSQRPLKDQRMVPYVKKRVGAPSEPEQKDVPF